MAITIKFFASLKDTIGISTTELPPPLPDTVGDVWNAVTDIKMPDNTLCAVNMEYVKINHPINDNDEIAFFPPVTGG